MGRVKRLKAPAGQRSSNPGQDQKERPTVTASPFRVTDPAQFLYLAFAESKGWKDAHGKMKKWQELSVHDRRAWAAVNRHMIDASGHISIPLPPEDGTSVFILARDGAVYTVRDTKLAELVKIADVRKVLGEIAAEIEKLKGEYAEMESRVWKIREPEKFEAPAR